MGRREYLVNCNSAETLAGAGDRLNQRPVSSSARAATHVTGHTSLVAEHTSFADVSPCLVGACRSFVGVSASCCGPSTNDVPALTSLVDGSAYDVDAPTYDHDSFESNVEAST